METNVAPLIQALADTLNAKFYYIDDFGVSKLRSVLSEEDTEIVRVKVMNLIKEI